MDAEKLREEYQSWQYAWATGLEGSEDELRLSAEALIAALEAALAAAEAKVARSGYGQSRFYPVMWSDFEGCNGGESYAWAAMWQSYCDERRPYPYGAEWLLYTDANWRKDRLVAVERERDRWEWMLGRALSLAYQTKAHSTIKHVLPAESVWVKNTLDGLNAGYDAAHPAPEEEADREGR